MTLAATALLALAGGCSQTAAADGAPHVAEQPVVAAPIAVRVTAVRRGTLRAELPYVGIVRPRREVKVAARVGGTVARQLLEVGDAVARGQVLVQIQAPELQAKAASLKAESERLRALERQACKVARTDRGLAKRGALPQVRADASAAQCKSAQAAMRAVRGKRQELDISVGRRQAKAPVAGRLLRWLVEPGETVGPGRPLALLATGAQELELLVTDTDMARGVSEGSVVTVSAPGASGGARSAVTKVVRVAPMAAGSLRHVAVRVALPPAFANATTGAALDARLLLSEVRDATIVPLRAVALDVGGGASGGESAVFIARKSPQGRHDGVGSDATAERHVVHLGLRSGGDVAITPPLPAGAAVITSNLTTLRSGQPLFTVRERELRASSVVQPSPVVQPSATVRPSATVQPSSAVEVQP